MYQMEVLFGKVKDATGVAETHVSASRSPPCPGSIPQHTDLLLKDTPFLLQLLHHFSAAFYSKTQGALYIHHHSLSCLFLYQGY